MPKKKNNFEHGYKNICISTLHIDNNFPKNLKLRKMGKKGKKCRGKFPQLPLKFRIASTSSRPSIRKNNPRDDAQI